VQELFVEYGTEPESRRRPAIPHRCWRALFSGLSALKTLHFGDGAAELLVSASYGACAAPSRGPLSASVQRVIVSGSAFSRRILWRWIHYAFARPAGEEDASLVLRKDVLALLSEPRWKSADIDPGEDVTESLLVFLLCCRPMGVQVSELSLVESTWDYDDSDSSGGLDVLQRLLRMLDPDRNTILETLSRGDHCSSTN
jgi:hypothetical protein